MDATRKIIEMFGGQRRLADILGHSHQTTVQGWMKRGTIPARQIPVVMKAARRLGLDISYEDFFQTPRSN